MSRAYEANKADKADKVSEEKRNEKRNGKRKAVVILSGGLDSTTCMGIAQQEGFEVYPITFDYKQRHRSEINNARAVAHFYGCEAQHRVIDLSFLGQFGGSALTDESIDVPHGADVAFVKDDSSVGDTDSVIDADSKISEDNTISADSVIDDIAIPVTYVPGRNLLFLSIAASFAEAIGAEAIYIGVNDVDYSGYPDCRPEFIAKFEEVMTYGTKVGIEEHGLRVETPIISLSKADIIRTGMKLGVPYHLTTSCYNGGEQACGDCDSCRLRLKGFADAGMRDPIKYKHAH